MSVFAPRAPAATPSLPALPPSSSGNLFARMAQLQAQGPMATNSAYQPQQQNSTSTYCSTLPTQPPSQTTPQPPNISQSMRDQAAAAAATSVLDPSKTLDHFSLFLHLPLEIITCIIEQCAPASAVCLALTSKPLYALARPMLLRRDHRAFLLWDRNRKCNCPKAYVNRVRRSSHNACESCNGQYCSTYHSCQLGTLLQSWVPEGLEFCPHYYCKKFKNKWRFFKGRCLHGQSRPKKRDPGRNSLTWTHKRGVGGWHHSGKGWKTLYTEANLAMALDRYKVGRTTNSGYSLRQRPKPTMKRLEHRETRGGWCLSREQYSEWQAFRSWNGGSNGRGAVLRDQEMRWRNRKTGEVRMERPSEEEEFGGVGWGVESEGEENVGPRRSIRRRF